MDNFVDAMDTSYTNFVLAIAHLFEANSASDCEEETPATIAALENLKLKWTLYWAACDQTAGFVMSLKRRIASECLVDKASCSAIGNSGQTGVQPINAVRLEQMSKEIRSLAVDLQNGSESVGSSSVGFDEDSTQ